MSASRDEFNHSMAQIFSIWFEIQEVQDNLPEWNYQDWIAWADEQILKWEGTPPWWLCEISCAKSKQDVIDFLGSGYWDWSSTVSQEIVEVSCERSHIGWLYLKFQRNEMTLQEFLDSTWYDVEHSSGSERSIRAFSSALAKLEREWMSQKSDRLANDRDFLEQLAVWFFPLGDRVYQRLQKLPIKL